MKKVLTAVTMTLLAATSVQADEITWSGTVQQVFDKHCITCHGSDASEYAAFKKDKEAWLKKGIGMRMDTYSHLVAFVGWPNSGALMRRLDDGKGSKEGKPGNMYQHLGGDEQERQANLALFKQWVGNWNLKRWADLSKDDLSGVKVKY
jgi:mono/diheme cytochrome c family protein